MVQELISRGQVTPVPTRVTVYRFLVLHDLIDLTRHRVGTASDQAGCSQGLIVVVVGKPLGSGLGDLSGYSG